MFNFGFRRLYFVQLVVHVIYFFDELAIYNSLSFLIVQVFQYCVSTSIQSLINEGTIR